MKFKLKNTSLIYIIPLVIILEIINKYFVDSYILNTITNILIVVMIILYIVYLVKLKNKN